MAIASIVHFPAGVELGRATTTRIFALGTQAFGDNGAEWVYCTFGAAHAYGDAVSINHDFTTAALASTAVLGSRAGSVVTTTGSAANSFGWVQVDGQAPLNVAASLGANVAVASSAVAGRVGPAAGATGQRNLLGVVLPVANAASPAVIEATFINPSIGTTI